MNAEFQKVKAKLADLLRQPKHRFPTPGDRLKETPERGVYVIYSPRGRVLHVGVTPRGKRGIRQRLNNHLQGQSSFANKSEYLWKYGGRTLKSRRTYVRQHCRYCCLVIENERLRILLEAYAIGCLCPAHIGLHQVAA